MSTRQSEKTIIDTILPNLRTVVVASVTDGHTTKMGAHAEHDQEFLVRCPLLVRLLVPELAHVHVVGNVDFVGGPVADENGLAAPLENDVLALGNGGQVNLDLGQGQHIGRSRKRRKPVDEGSLDTDGRNGTERANHGVGEDAVGVLVTRPLVRRKVGDGFGVLEGAGGVVEKALLRRGSSEGH